MMKNHRQSQKREKEEKCEWSVKLWAEWAEETRAEKMSGEATNDN